ncbi:hypothetical protein HPB50_017674 [Hyalomma asiaticum]|uniref:Uncharacterized protein n=1 Tax=Hyalomma asiaticum TaxID=266040 RepID=A0ACB7SIY5_HYAAI|nr:hypothetical protein HPB50_017674 [Hyalomma asiaticum]
MCTEETTVAGVRFKPGMCVDIPLAGIHHDAEYFPEPEKFNPERFLPENKDNVRPFTYMPFGVGPRNCVAMRLGILQAKASLACLFRKVKLETCPETMSFTSATIRGVSAEALAWCPVDAAMT